jgi:hypothetical protein
MAQLEACMGRVEIPYEHLKMIFSDLPVTSERTDQRNVNSHQVLLEQVWDQIQALELPYTRDLLSPEALELMRRSYQHKRGVVLNGR